MTRRRVVDGGIEYTVSPDGPRVAESLWWAVLRTRVLDELTGAPPLAPLRITTATPGCRPHAGPDGLCGLTARPAEASTALVGAGKLTATIEAEGYLPLALDAAIDAARYRATLPGPAATTRLLTIAPSEAPPRRQFVPGRCVVVERATKSSPEQFALVDAAATAPANNEVPLTLSVHGYAPPAATAGNVAGIPIVLPDQALHLAAAVSIKVRVLRQNINKPTDAAQPVGNARVGICDVAWTLNELTATASTPPLHAPNMASLTAPLKFAHAKGAPVEGYDLIRIFNAALQTPCRAGDAVIALHPWTTLDPTGGELLDIDSPQSPLREIAVGAGFELPADAALPALMRLRTPMAFPHPAGTSVAAVSKAANQAASALERPAIAGDRMLFVTNPPPDMLESAIAFEAGTPREEWRFARYFPAYAAGAFSRRNSPVGPDVAIELPPIARVAGIWLYAEHDDPANGISLATSQVIAFTPDYRGENAVQILVHP